MASPILAYNIIATTATGESAGGFQLPPDDVLVDQDPFAPVAGVPVNPTRMQWDDPARPGRKVTAEFKWWKAPAINDGVGLTAQIYAISEAGPSPKSEPSAPFTIERPTPPTTPTGFGVFA